MNKRFLAFAESCPGWFGILLLVGIISLPGCHGKKQSNGIAVADLDSTDSSMRVHENRVLEAKEDLEDRESIRFFLFKVEANCSKAISAFDSLAKYDDKPFHVKLANTTDSLFVDFDLVKACCLEFTGDIGRADSELKLTFEPIDPVPCECHCIYRFHYAIVKKDSHWISVYINELVLTIPHVIPN